MSEEWSWGDNGDWGNWLFQPGRVKGVRWTIHHVKTDDSVDEAEAMTSSVFQLLAGVRLRRVFSLNVRALVTTTPRLAEHESFFFYVASGIAEFAVLTDNQETREMRVLMPGHGLVVPSGVIYALCALSDLMLIVGSDSEEPHPSNPVLLDRKVPWLARSTK